MLIIISVQIINFPFFVFPYSVEWTPHVGKEREGGRASYGTEGTAQRGGDLHRRLNSAPPDTPTHTHTRWLSRRTSACKRKHNYSSTHTCKHAPTVDEWTDYPQYHGSTFTTPRVTATPNSAELRLAFGYFLPYTYRMCAYTHTQIFYLFSSHTICPKSASHFRPIHTLTFILSLAPLDTDMKLHVCGIASHHPQWFVFRQHAPDSPRISQDRRPCIELCRLKHSAISQANPHRKLAWLFWSFRVPSTSFNLKAIFNLNALKGLKILSSFTFQTCILPWNTRYFEELFFCPYNETQWGPKQHWNEMSFIAWSENTFFKISSVL